MHVHPIKTFALEQTRVVGSCKWHYTATLDHLAVECRLRQAAPPTKHVELLG